MLELPVLVQEPAHTPRHYTLLMMLLVMVQEAFGQYLTAIEF